MMVVTDELPGRPPHRDEQYAPVGAVVRNSYWQEHYTVVAHNDDGTVTIRWHGDNRIGEPNQPRTSTHRTALDQRDRIVREPATDAEVTELLALANELQLKHDHATARHAIERAGSLKAAKRRLHDAAKRRAAGIVARHERALTAAETERRREIHAGRRRAAEARERRASRPLLERLAVGLVEAKALASVRGMSYEPSGGGSDETPLFPSGGENELADDYVRMVEILVDALEREVDQARYGLPAEKLSVRDQRILTVGRGLPAYRLAGLDRTVGSPDTVERVRDKAGLSRHLGEERRDDRSAAA